MLHEVPDSVAAQSKTLQDRILKEVSTRNAQFFEAELKKLDGWADDQIASTEKALRDVKKRIRDLRNEASKTSGLNEQAKIQDQISDLERSKRKLRQEIFEAEDRILTQRDGLVGKIRGKLKQKTSTKPLFSLRWTLN
jgi:predicted  nucleic acid-binding Zn-ribbon protein